MATPSNMVKNNIRMIILKERLLVFIMIKFYMQILFAISYSLLAIR